MAPPKSNAELEKEQKQIKLRPDELKDTDVEDEYKEDGKPGFRKQSGTSSGNTSAGKQSESAKAPSNDHLEKEQSQMKMKPDELMDTDAENEAKENGGSFRKNSGKARL